MSNPGVIVLAEQKPKKKYMLIKQDSFKRFQVEDNIGESIHIHLDNLRFDLSIKEFLFLTESITVSIEELLKNKDINVRKIDPLFFMKASDHWPHVKETKIENIELSKLRCIIHNRRNHIRKHITVNETPSFLYLTGKNKDFIDYKQDSYVGTNNRDRLLNLLSSLKKNPYPSDDEEYIILFGDQNYIRDGQHRAACLLYLGYKEIPVKRIFFEDYYLKYKEKNNYIGFLIETILKIFLRTKKNIRNLRNNI